jgi:pilus assembly protein Flp/PilA
MAMLCSVREHGQGLVEYAFLLILIAFIVIAVLLILGPTIVNVFNNLNNKLQTL